MDFCGFESPSNSATFLPISIYVCGRTSEAASVWYVTMLHGHLLYITINKRRQASFTVSFPRGLGWVNVFMLWSLGRCCRDTVCPRNRPRLCNSIHNSFHKHNMEAALSHMQTHGQIKEWVAKGDRGHSELFVKPLTDCLSQWELVCDRPK